MSRNTTYVFASIALALIVTCASCTGKVTKSASKTESSTAKTSNLKVQDDDDKKNVSKPARHKAMCELVTPADLKKITGLEYQTTRSVIALASITSCEYHHKEEKSVTTVIITAARGDTSKTRMASAKRFPNLKSISGLGEEAVWQPTMGNLAVLSENRCVDVSVPKKLGDDAARLKYAKQIVTLILERY